MLYKESKGEEQDVLLLKTSKKQNSFISFHSFI